MRHLHKALFLLPILCLSACVDTGVDETAAVYLGDGDSVTPITPNSMVGRAITQSDTNAQFSSFRDESRAQAIKRHRVTQNGAKFVSLAIKSAPVGNVKSENLDTSSVPALSVPKSLHAGNGFSNALHLPGGLK